MWPSKPNFFSMQTQRGWCCYCSRWICPKHCYMRSQTDLDMKHRSLSASRCRPNLLRIPAEPIRGGKVVIQRVSTRVGQRSLCLCMNRYQAIPLHCLGCDYCSRFAVQGFVARCHSTHVFWRRGMQPAWPKKVGMVGLQHATNIKKGLEMKGRKASRIKTWRRSPRQIQPANSRRANDEETTHLFKTSPPT